MKGDSVIRHCIATWSPSFRELMTSKGDDRCFALQHAGQWSLQLAVQDEERRLTLTLDVGAEAIEPEDKRVVQWGLLKIGPTVWTLHRSIHFVGLYHAYVVLRGVPEPAPWEDACSEACGIPAQTLPPCDLPWGHDGDRHANAGDGFYAPDHEEEHHRRQAERRSRS